jgi:iron(III) transport system permease protein
MRQLPWWSDLDSGPVDVYTMPWIIIITGFGLTAFVYLFVSTGLQNINSELIEAAQVSGSRPLGVFFRITLPLLRPVLVYGGGVALLLGLGQFTGPLLLGRQAGISVLTTDMYLAVVILSKFLLGDQARFVTHGGKAFRSQARPSKLATAAIIGYFLLATGLPVFALTVVALSKFWSGDIDVSEFTLDNLRQIFAESGIVDAIVNSVTLSLLSVLIALPVGFIAASLLVKGRRFPIIRSLVDFIITMPLGIPAVIFGVGFLLTYTRPPFVLYGTRWVIVLVYVTLMLPFTTRMQLGGMVALGNTYIEAARVSGANSLRTNVQIILPLMRPTIGAASALMFVLLTHEFAASLLVRAPTIQVMGTVLFDFWTNGSYPLVAAIALVMSVVTATGVAIAVVVGGSDVFSKL